MINGAVLIAAAGVTAAAWLLCCPRLPALADAPPKPSMISHWLSPMQLAAVVAGAGLGWAVLGGVLGLAGGAVVGVVGGRWILSQADSGEVKQQKQMVRDFPVVLGLLASIVESGAPVRFAAASVCQVVDGPAAEQLRGVVACCEVGFTDAEAWRTLIPDPVWSEVARDLARCVDTGAATGAVLAAAAEQASKTAAAESLTQARSVGVSSTLPLVVCFLPAFLLLGVVPIVGGLIGNYMTNF